MKKFIILLFSLFLLTGCTNVNNLSFDEVTNELAVKKHKSNIYRTGYNYYLPKGMQVVDSSLYNEKLEDSYNKYYLYVDIVSYYKEVVKDYKVNEKAVYSQKLNYNGKFGYIEINLTQNDKYLVEIMYNYAKIEVIVDSKNVNVALISAINILKSVEYNDSIVANLLGDDVLNFYEEEFDIFNTKGSEKKYLTVDDSYTEEEDKNKIPDPDMIN